MPAIPVMMFSCVQMPFVQVSIHPGKGTLDQALSLRRIDEVPTYLLVLLVLRPSVRRPLLLDGDDVDKALFSQLLRVVERRVDARTIASKGLGEEVSPLLHGTVIG